MDKVNNELAAALAHEIKNPLTLIRANLDCIKISCKGKCSHNFHIIDRELDKLSSLISDYTAILSPGRGNELIFPEDIIYDITEEFSVLNKHIQFNFNIYNNISIKGDSRKLTILLFNIYKNAVEAIEGKGTITTSLYKKNNSIVISVTDTGKGISENTYKNIGTPFFTTKENGTGIGLMISKSIASSYNGTVTLTAGNTGCTATITLSLL